MFAKALALLVSVLIGSVSVAAPLEAYGKLPYYENVALSPDGARAAYVTTLGEERTVIIQNFNDPKDTTQLRAGNEKLRDLRWASPEHLLITTSESSGYIPYSPTEFSRLLVYDLRRKSSYEPATLVKDVFLVPYGSAEVREIGGKPYLFLQYLIPEFGTKQVILTLAKLDLKEKKSTVVDESRTKLGSLVRWYLDAGGVPIAQTEYNEAESLWMIRTKLDNRWVEADREQVQLETPGFVGLSPEDGNIVIERRENNELVWRNFSVTSGKWGDAFVKGYQANGRLVDPITYRITAILRVEARTRYQFISNEDQQRWDQIAASFPNEEVFFESWTTDKKKIVVRVFGKKTGSAYALADLTNGSISRVGNLYKGIEATDLARVLPIQYEAVDGLRIHGYLTVPNDRPLKSLPLVVMPHGGPEARDRLDFDYQAQALAARGYAVLQPNFRGSWGYGIAFQEAGYREFGRKMQTDLSDGVRYLVKQGLADPARVCIVGASYGGYAALAGAAFEDVYRCAVSIAGVADLRLMMQWIARRAGDSNARSIRYWHRYYGVTAEDDSALDDLSPINKTDRIKIPILLIHGKEDSVVPFKQSEVMAAKLAKAKANHVFVKLNGEDHWLSRAETRLQMLQSTVKFLETHNPP
jgi:dipeptidyl aminopeptidase/acylaminoacyl peptidase